MIHPQSYVHSIIRFKNGLIKMILYNTDMKIPISNILYEGKNYTAPLKRSRGYYLDLGYNIGNIINTDKLIPWFRVSNVSTDVDTDAKITDYMRFGLTWWPIDNVAFKMDYGTKTKKSDSDNHITQINLGIGYNF